MQILILLYSGNLVHMGASGLPCKMKDPSFAYKVQRFFHYRGFSFRDLGGGLADSILVAGAGRSGTTWIAEVLAQSAKLRIIFEPFMLDQLGRFPVTKSLRLVEDQLHWNHQLYIAPTAESAHHAEIDQILRGKTHNVWCDRDPRFRTYRRRLIKTIRANLMLGYIRRNFPEVAMIIVNRDPLQVINSQMFMADSFGWRFDWTPEIAMSQPELMRDILSPFKDLIVAASTRAERLAHKWCIETLVPLMQLSGDPGVLFVNHDQLRRSPDIWPQIFAHCDQTVPSFDRQFDALLAKESSVTRGTSKKKWLLLDDDERAINRIVDAYGLQYLREFKGKGCGSFEPTTAKDLIRTGTR